jgi:hypothetical protein
MIYVIPDAIKTSRGALYPIFQENEGPSLLLESADRSIIDEASRLLGSIRRDTSCPGVKRAVRLLEAVVGGMAAVMEGVEDGQGKQLPPPDYVYVRSIGLWRSAQVANRVRRDWQAGLYPDEAQSV